MNRSLSHFLMLLSLMLVVATTSGCGKKTHKADPAEVGHIKKLAILYGRFSAANRGQPPPNEAVFKKFIMALPVTVADSLKVDVGNIEGMFRSPRDQQPYVIRYNTIAGPAGPGGTPVLIYEQTGVNGKRMVAFATAGAEEVDAVKFAELVPGG